MNERTKLAQSRRHPSRSTRGAPHFHLEGAGGTDNEHPQPHVAAAGVHKSYWKGRIEVPVLCGLSMEARHGEFLSIVGQSGSGKSTLLHVLGTLDAPDSGAVYFQGERADAMPKWRQERLRNRSIGMIFQFYHLLPELTTLENVLVPKMISEGLLRYFGNRRRHMTEAKQLLERVGLAHRHRHYPKELSGGEMQRAAIARALISGPELLLADEPTGNLDTSTGRGILTLLRTLNRRDGLTIVMVTHDLAIAAEADRVLHLEEGRASTA